ncbi:MAG: NAD(P)-dependent oxidoreductase [Acidobacteria bacterium]|nr:NAD(P)-dependent oxidoreductase [Acidobacteriota bacterium]
MRTAADCLVTGGTGFLGRSVVSLLLRKGASVRCLVRGTPETRKFNSTWSAIQSARAEIVHGNLLSPADMRRCTEGARVVYHLATESRGLPATIFATAVLGSRNLLEAILRARPQRVVLVSSLNVYDLALADRKRPISEHSAIEQHPEKRDVYTHSKIWQEHLFRTYLSGTGIEITVVRPGYIYGPGHNTLAPRMGLSLGNLLLHVKSTTRVPTTYVENCADAVVFCATTKEAANETYNVVDDDLPTVSQYLAVCRRLAPKIRAVRTPFIAISGLCYLNGLAHKYSAGQIPLVLTPYKAACAWRGHSFSNQHLKALGWQQPIPTREALAHAFSPLSAPASVLPLRTAT